MFKKPATLSLQPERQITMLDRVGPRNQCDTSDAGGCAISGNDVVFCQRGSRMKAGKPQSVQISHGALELPYFISTFALSILGHTNRNFLLPFLYFSSDHHTWLVLVYHVAERALAHGQLSNNKF